MNRGVAVALVVSIAWSAAAVAGPVPDDVCRPSAPRDVTMESQDDPPGTMVRWSPPITVPVTGLEGYRIYRAMSGNDPVFVPIAEVPPEAASYFDGDVQPGVDYLYGVTAYNACGESAMAAAHPYPSCDLLEPTWDPTRPGGIWVYVHSECL